MLRIQCYFRHRKDSDSRVKGGATKVTYDGNNKPKEGRRESHDYIDPLSLRYLVPLRIDGDKEERNKDAYRIP